MQRTSGFALAGALGIAILAWALPAGAQQRSIVVASTTSTRELGLFEKLLPAFKARTGIEVKVVAQGTGQALATGRRGDADVLFVHAKAQEQKFIADGFGVRRFDVMYNDFVLIGPAKDPARIKGGNDIVKALKAINTAASPFVSRGDKSGTHSAELRLWTAAGLDPQKDKPKWYRAIGQGMGAALSTAQAMGGYVLSDRGTWIAFKSKQDMTIVVEGDKRLFNQYGIMLVSPKRFPHVKAADGHAFVDWVVGPEGQGVIRDYKIAGKQLFFPNAAPGH